MLLARHVTRLAATELRETSGEKRNENLSRLVQQGMHHLQNSSIQIHGNLKSSNVVIDSRWTCKVTDHNLFRFKEGEEVDLEAGENTKYYGTYDYCGQKIE